jgi:ribonuclease HII
MLPLPVLPQGQSVIGGRLLPHPSGGAFNSQSTIRDQEMPADLSMELELWQSGVRAVAGVDEAGRGAWAGPVVAAAVILPSDMQALASLLGRVDDSKRLTPLARERALDRIRSTAVAVGIGFGGVDEIERTGILAATQTAMARALESLAPQPDFVLLDYLTLPDWSGPQRGVTHGDALSLSIAAASIVAKVTRDRWMAEQDARYPGYDFGRHKGYGTPQHQAALEQLGLCLLHRRTFRPVGAAGGRS